jgi:hypothetical protein
MNQYVIYTNSNQAWLQNDNMSGKLARAVNMAGVRLIRGWDEVIKFQSGLDKAAAAAAATKDRRLSSVSRTEERDGGLDMDTPAASNFPQVNLDEPEEEQARQIDHLVFVIHGWVAGFC